MHKKKLSLARETLQRLEASQVIHGAFSLSCVVSDYYTCWTDCDACYGSTNWPTCAGSNCNTCHSGGCQTNRCV